MYFSFKFIFRPRQLEIAIVLFLLLAFSCASRKYDTGKLNKASFDLNLPADTKMPMAWVSPGKFMMGSPATETGRKADEGPQAEVTLTKGYWIGKTEVTVGQWKAMTGMSLRYKVMQMLNDDTLREFNGKMSRLRDFMNFDPTKPDEIMGNENDHMPMYFVSWNEAMAFCKKLTAFEKANGTLPVGYEYSLPTEAQWEHACRAGSKGAIYNESAGLDAIAWYGKNSANGYKGRTVGNSKSGPRDVAGKLPNALGMYDTLGNLWEWCYDWYGPFTGVKLTDPIGPAHGHFKVNKGGSFGSGPNDERIANRAQNPPNEDSAYRGFRVVLTVVR